MAAACGSLTRDDEEGKNGFGGQTRQGKKTAEGGGVRAEIPTLLRVDYILIQSDRIVNLCIIFEPIHKMILINLSWDVEQ